MEAHHDLRDFEQGLIVGAYEMGSFHFGNQDEIQIFKFNSFKGLYLDHKVCGKTLGMQHRRGWGKALDSWEHRHCNKWPAFHIAANYSAIHYWDP